MHISHNPDRTEAERHPKIVIFGCGNTLLGDDGFGPAVIELLEQQPLPEGVRVVDAGTGIREYLLDYLLLPALRPELIIIVDSGFRPGLAAGTIREERPGMIAATKQHDYSLHQFPSVNLLREVEEETGIEVVLLIAQVEDIPETISQGLSAVIGEAVDAASSRILQILSRKIPNEMTTP